MRCLAHIFKRRTRRAARLLTDQVAVLSVHFVGHVLEVGEFAGVNWQRGAIFEPPVGGWWGAFRVKAGQ